MQKKHLIKYTAIYDKNAQQSGSRWSIPQHNKGHIQETYCQHHTQWAKTKTFPNKISNKTRVPALTTFIQHSIESCSHSNQTRKRNKRHPNWKGGSKLLLFTDDMIVYIENYRELVRVAMGNVAQPWFGKLTGVRRHTVSRPTDWLSHGEPGLHYI